MAIGKDVTATSIRFDSLRRHAEAYADFLMACGSIGKSPDGSIPVIRNRNAVHNVRACRLGASTAAFRRSGHFFISMTAACFNSLM